MMGLMAYIFLLMMICGASAQSMFVCMYSIRYADDAVLLNSNIPTFHMQMFKCSFCL